MSILWKNLRVFNGIAGVLHLLQAGLMFFIASGDASRATAQITTNYLSFNFEPIFEAIAREASSEEIAAIAETNIGPELNTVFSVELAPFVGLFLLLSAIAHFVIISPGVYPYYRKMLGGNINYFRWIEYALSSSVMIMVIAALSGVFDLPSLIMLFSLNAIMNLMGLMMEKHNQTTKSTDWTAFIIGCLAGIVPWVVILMYFFGAVGQVEGVDEPVIPEFVYGILISIFIFFNSFALNMFLQYQKVGWWKNYLFGERVYIVLSLIAKTALAWQVFAGTLRPA